MAARANVDAQSADGTYTAVCNAPMYSLCASCKCSLCLNVQLEGMKLTSILGEQHILSFQVSMDDLVAVEEDQTADDVQRNQVTLAADQHHIINTQ